MNGFVNKYRTTGLILMMIASVSFFFINLIYWSIFIISAGESPIISAVLLSLFFGSIPAAITLITYFFPPLGSIIAIVISLIMLAFWIIALVANSSQANPVMIFGGLPLSVIFLSGGVFSFIYAKNR